MTPHARTTDHSVGSGGTEASDRSNLMESSRMDSRSPRVGRSERASSVLAGEERLAIHSTNLDSIVSHEARSSSLAWSRCSRRRSGSEVSPPVRIVQRGRAPPHPCAPSARLTSVEVTFGDPGTP